jgi:hypothetical protein
MSTDYEPWINNFYVDREFVWQEEYTQTPVAIGDGLLHPGMSKNYRRYRVLDIWYSHDSHGRFDVGRHVFLKDVTGTKDDLLGNLAPSYFED